MQKRKTGIICIAGPTGAGKSAVALRLARRFADLGRPCAVLNADSRQIYADFPIITAQPDARERSVCPHHLYGFLPASEKISAGEYARLAGECIGGMARRGVLPLVVGGAGLYFRSLLQGIAVIPDVPAEIRRKWQGLCHAEGSAALHVRLREIDPEYASRIHPNDRQRVTRALEVWEGTGRALSHWHRLQREGREAGSGYSALYLGVGLDLPELEPRLASRIEFMLQSGAIEEARAALKNCADASAPGWSGIGCAELYRHIRGELSLEECRELWLRNTRAYAKRQLTWFRAEKGIRWFRPGQDGEMAEFILTGAGNEYF